MGKKIIDRSLLVFCLFLPVIMLFICIHHYGVNIAFWDEWTVIDLYNDVLSNGVSFSKLFAQHNEHRIFFPRIIMLISYCFTSCNSKFVMYISACVLAVSYFFIVKSIFGNRRMMGYKGKDVLFSALLGFCLMSACQYENLLWGFQIAWFLVEMSVIGSLVFFYKYLKSSEAKYWFVSVLFATIATYSALQGVAVWPMYAGVFLLVSFSNRTCGKWKQWIPYAVVGAIELVLYFHGYSNVAGHEDFKADGLQQCMEFMMAQLGHIFCNSNQDVAKYLGLIITVVAVFLILYLIFQKKIEEYLVPVGMIVFAIGVMMMISIGRSNLALSSRYTTYALMVPVGELAIIYREMNIDTDGIANGRDWRQAFIAIEGMLLALCIVESVDSLQMCSGVYTERMAAKEALQNYRDVPLGELERAFPWQDYKQAYEKLGLLEENKWNALEEERMLYAEVNLDGYEISQDPLMAYSIDSVEMDGQVLSLWGWAVQEHFMETYGNAYVRVNGIVFGSKDHQERADVAQNLGNDVYRYSGFSFSKSAEVFHEGVNTISLLVSDVGRHTIYESADQYVYYTKADGIYRCDESGNAIGQ